MKNDEKPNGTGRSPVIDSAFVSLTIIWRTRDVQNDEQNVSQRRSYSELPWAKSAYENSLL